jgi:hypothetical protein
MVHGDAKIDGDAIITGQLSGDLVGETFTLDLDAGTQPKQITSNDIGGSATMELQTADNNGILKTRLLLRGSSSDAIEFYDKYESKFIHFDGNTRETEFINGHVGINDTPGSEELRIKGSVYIEGSTYPYLPFQIDNGGRVGINGTPNSSYHLTLNGDMQVTGAIIGESSTKGSMMFDVPNRTVQISGGSETQYALYVDGATWCTESWGSSDRKLKKNISDLNANQIINKIQKIKGKKYQYKDRNELIQMHDNKQVQFPVDTIDLEAEKKGLINIEDNGDSIIVADSVLKQKLRYDRKVTLDGKEYGLRIEAPYLSKRDKYGLIAQDIKDEFPELVKFDSTSMLYGVNYEGFVPVLLEAVKAQQTQIREKEKRINNDSIRIADLEGRVATLESEIEMIKSQCCSSMVEEKSRPTASLKVNKTPQAKLYQNIPNPFTERTRIEYYLPRSTGEARLYIYDMQGYQIENYYISTFGEGSITIQGGSMQPGMYMYTLIADGREVETKKMILTK